MITGTTGAVKANFREDMNGLPFAIKYFDDDANIYLSRQLFEHTRTGGTPLRYMVMAWRQNSITVDEMISTLRTAIVEYGKETGQIT